ncbi:hypothetical protein RYX36_008972 [Vicia faba]
MLKTGFSRPAGNKFCITPGLPIMAKVNCANNTEGKNLYIISIKGNKGRLKCLPSGCVGDMLMGTEVQYEEKGKMNGFFIIGPIHKEYVDLRRRIANAANVII